MEEHGPFVEIHVRTSLDECARRDVNGLYAKAFAGEIKGFTGVDDPYEAPANAEIVVDTEGLEPEESAARRRREARGARTRRCEGDGVTAVTTDRLIAPHGGTLVDRTGDAPDDLGSLEVVTLTSRELSDLDMIASGALSPLEGFMGKADYERVVEEMHLASGLPWALPVCLAVDSAPTGDRVALADEAGRPIAVLEVEETFEYDKEREAEHCFRTTDDAHPGVARLYAQKPLYLAGRVTVFERASAEFPELARDPAETRRIFAERGWKRVVGFQTRNPIHRAHEYLTKVALETVDGLLVHPLVGDTKSDDVPVDVRVECYETLLDGYYPEDRVLLSAFPAAMRYAGPREAVWHAICRKNYGCSHFIVGRDHAGVGDYYGTYDAQLIFDEFAPHELDIEPMFFEHTFWCNVCGSMASTKSCPHGPEDRVFLSGTKVREMLGAGEVPPGRVHASRGRQGAHRRVQAVRELESPVTWQLTLVGLFTGLLVGMTGMGGGSLMTPILVFLFGIPPSTAIGTDIAHGAAFKTVSAVQHRRMGNVRARLAGWMLIGSAPASLLGVWLNVELVGALRRRRRVGHGPGARRCAAVRRRRPDREERRPGRPDRRSRLEPLEP